jgi:hypothetical protein
VSEQSGSPAMSGVVIVVSVVCVLVALFVVLGGGDEPSESASLQPEGISPTSAAASRLESLGSATDSSSAFEELGRGTSNSVEFDKAGDLDTNLDNENSARLREIREAQERPMPSSVARDFERGMVEPTDEEFEAFRRGMDEMPAHVARDLAEAPTRRIPTGVREAFDNPYPPLSEEDLKALHQRGPEIVTP